MLKFHSISLKDQQPFMQCAAQHNDRLCEYCFADLFIWKDHYDTQICFRDGFALVKCATFPDKTPMYLAPIGAGDLADALHALMADAQERGVRFLLGGIPERLVQDIRRGMPEELEIADACDTMDYIYISERMISLSGKKLQSKRNYANRFRREQEGRWTYEPIDEHNKHDAFAFHLKWTEKNNTCERGLEYSGETCAVSLLLQNFEAFDARGGLIRIDGETVAFTLGCPLSADTFDIQIEKADADIPGAYAVINQEFARRNCADYTYINREDDLGLEGLRRAKLSYHPEILAKKYIAVRKHDSIC